MPGEFINGSSGCVSKRNDGVSMHRLHINDEVYYNNGIRSADLMYFPKGIIR